MLMAMRMMVKILIECRMLADPLHLLTGGSRLHQKLAEAKSSPKCQEIFLPNISTKNWRHKIEPKMSRDISVKANGAQDPKYPANKLIPKHLKPISNQICVKNWQLAIKWNLKCVDLFSPNDTDSRIFWLSFWFRKVKFLVKIQNILMKESKAFFPQKVIPTQVPLQEKCLDLWIQTIYFHHTLAGHKQHRIHSDRSFVLLCKAKIGGPPVLSVFANCSWRLCSIVPGVSISSSHCWNL